MNTDCQDCIKRCFPTDPTIPGGKYNKSLCYFCPEYGETEVDIVRQEVAALKGDPHYDRDLTGLHKRVTQFHSRLNYLQNKINEVHDKKKQVSAPF